MSRSNKGVVVVVLALALTLGANLSWGDTPPGPTAYGMTYGQWGAAFWQWVTLCTPENQVMLDTTGQYADVNQILSGDVFFLTGSWSGSEPVVRHVTVPMGKAFFFPIFNWVLSYPEDVPTKYRKSEQDAEAWIRNMLNSTFDGVDPANLVCVVDGKKVPNQIYRAQSPAFNMYFPPDCYEVLLDHSITTGSAYQAGLHYPTISDGYWVMLEPLPAGLHTIQIQAGPPEALWLDVTYQLTVRGK